MSVTNYITPCNILRHPPNSQTQIPLPPLTSNLAPSTPPADLAPTRARAGSPNATTDHSHLPSRLGTPHRLSANPSPNPGLKFPSTPWVSSSRHMRLSRPLPTSGAQGADHQSPAQQLSPLALASSADDPSKKVTSPYLLLGSFPSSYNSVKQAPVLFQFCTFFPLNRLLLPQNAFF